MTNDNFESVPEEMKFEEDSLASNEDDEEENRLINQNNDLEKEFLLLKEQIKEQEAQHEIENVKAKELESCLCEIKEMGEKLK
jgi:hypothetical protein